MSRECVTESGKPKVRFETASEAKREARKLRMSPGARNYGRARAYHCSVCNYYHLGHATPGQERRKGT